jgi:DNA-binding NtrC family response regulator
MQKGIYALKKKLTLLDKLNLCEEIDSQSFKRKVELLKDVALILLSEIEALECVRSVNISEGINLHEEMRMFEVHLIQSALERTGGHQTRAAQLLGINLTTLHNKLKRLNISANDLVNAPIIHEDEVYKNPVKDTLTPLGDEHFSRLAA